MSDDKPEDDSKSQKGQQVRLQIKASDEAAKGVYSNITFAHYNDNDFILDFIFMEPQRPQGQLVSRVITNPKSAKKLEAVLHELIRRYEERHGVIELPKVPGPQGTYH